MTDITLIYLATFLLATIGLPFAVIMFSIAAGVVVYFYKVAVTLLGNADELHDPVKSIAKRIGKE